jgi:hypothetical protein
MNHLALLSPVLSSLEIIFAVACLRVSLELHREDCDGEERADVVKQIR